MRPLAITERMMARRMGISQEMLSDFLKGKTRVTERMAIALSRGTITPQEFWERAQKAFDRQTPPKVYKEDRPKKVKSSTPIHHDLKPLREIEKNYILKVLSFFKGNRTQTANALQISIESLRRKLKAWNMNSPIPKQIQKS